MNDVPRPAVVRGVVVLAAEAGRALREGRLPRRRDVLDWSGEFGAGDGVYATMRGRDGGQGVVALATSAINARTLSCPLSGWSEADDGVVLRGQGLDVFWIAGQ